jgi:hypothetical protein
MLPQKYRRVNVDPMPTVPSRHPQGCADPGARRGNLRARDSEVEAAIQSSLETLMARKTVIAVAHRLSTIARMDRLIVARCGPHRRAGHA